MPNSRSILCGFLGPGDKFHISPPKYGYFLKGGKFWGFLEKHEKTPI
jgi:hypothetical protein